MSAPTPLTHLSEEELLLQSTVRRFAAEAIAPHVRQMDEDQHFYPGLIPALAELGLLGIEIPEEFSGAGGTFFDAILAVEALAAVDPSVALIVDIQNTLSVNAILRWQFRPGSAFYLVYTHGVSSDALINARASISPALDLPVLRHLPSDDVVQMKVSWLIR